MSLYCFNEKSKRNLSHAMLERLLEVVNAFDNKKQCSHMKVCIYLYQVVKVSSLTCFQNSLQHTKLFFQFKMGGTRKDFRKMLLKTIYDGKNAFFCCCYRNQKEAQNAKQQDILKCYKFSTQLDLFMCELHTLCFRFVKIHFPPRLIYVHAFLR